jgi:hypothetical protein
MCLSIYLFTHFLSHSYSLYFLLAVFSIVCNFVESFFLLKHIVALFCAFVQPYIAPQTAPRAPTILNASSPSSHTCGLCTPRSASSRASAIRGLRSIAESQVLSRLVRVYRPLSQPGLAFFLF